MDQLTELLDRLSTVDIDQLLGDFLEREELVQLVVCQLLDHIDRLQADLDHEKKARRSAEAQLINTLQKRPASPTTDLGVRANSGRYESLYFIINNQIMVNTCQYLVIIMYSTIQSQYYNPHHQLRSVRHP
jgi:hypothetical protein